ncbi:hypothetical protein AAF712_010529 [Marasmius tenuissimus]|uniref:F-box domain-containing protein n=1 Tax=Marasmius tenuissimus TaxID=585030 RepID=A0ABR2ZLN9_9AGAR
MSTSTPHSFEDLLRAGRTLSSSDAALIDTQIQNLNGRIKERHESLNALQRQVSVLQRQILGLEAERTRHKSLFAPIRKCPPEILSLIFAQTVDMNVFTNEITDDPTYLRSSTTFEPSTLVEVCSHWRHVALSTPAIWALITIDFNLSSEIMYVDPERLRHAIKRCTERARELPLTVEVAIESRPFTTLPQHSNHPLVPRILEPLLDAPNYWRSFHLKVSSPITERVRVDFLRLFLPKFQTLERLVLQGPESSREFELIRQQNLQRIRSLELRTPYSIPTGRLISPSGSPFPFSQLTYLYLRDRSVDEVATILHLCANLVSVHLELLPAVGSLDDPNTPQSLDEENSGAPETGNRANTQDRAESTLVMKSLRCLTIELPELPLRRDLLTTLFGHSNTFPFTPVTRVLTGLTCPNLKTLALLTSEHHKRQYPISFAALKDLESFLQRSKLSRDGGLHKFVVSGFRLKDVKLLKVLQSMPGLTELVVEEHRSCHSLLTPKFLKGLTVHYPDLPLWNIDERTIANDILQEDIRAFFDGTLDEHALLGFNFLGSDNPFGVGNEEDPASSDARSESGIPSSASEASDNEDEGDETTSVHSVALLRTSCSYTHSPLLPNLRSIHLTARSDWKNDVFEKMVESRTLYLHPNIPRFVPPKEPIVPLTSPLLSVHVKILDPLAGRGGWEHGVPRLKRIQKAGLAVRVMDGSSKNGKPLLGYPTPKLRPLSST